jgi:tRNA dimethylallyltransferase
MKESFTKLVTVLGPTAAGKTSFSAHLASLLNGEIISADSRQVYRGMDIGTGKDYSDYIVNGRQIPVHLIDIIGAGGEYNIYLFKQDFLRSFLDIIKRGKTPVLCGGSGLYIESVLKNYNLLHVPPDERLRNELETKDIVELEGILKLYGPLHNQTDLTSRKRIIRAIEIAMFRTTQSEPVLNEMALSTVIFGISLERNMRRKRITERLMKRLEEGLVEEVKRLIASGVPSEKLDYYGLEYRYVSRYILNQITYDEMVQRLNSAIHQFAKRQMTYFRGMERRGNVIHWIDGSRPVEEMTYEAMTICKSVLNLPEQAT